MVNFTPQNSGFPSTADYQLQKNKMKIQPRKLSKNSQNIMIITKKSNFLIFYQ